MKYSRLFFFFVLMAAAVASFGAYDGTKPADDEYVADVPAVVRENFRAIKDDAIVNAGAISGYSVGSASGNIPRNDGKLNTDLVADKLDGYHGSDFTASGTFSTHENNTTTAHGGVVRTSGVNAMVGNFRLGGYWLSNDGGSEGVYVDTVGKVGIGTNAPDNMLDIASSSTVGTRLELTNSSVGGGRWQFISTGSGNGIGAGHLGFYSAAYGDYLLNILSSGRILVGTNVDDGTSKLQVGGSALVSGKLTLKLSSDIYHTLSDSRLNHGMTGLVPTDTFYSAEQYSGDGHGGTIIRSCTDTTDRTALFFVGVSGAASPANPTILFRSGKKNGTSYGALASTNPAIGFDNYLTRIMTLMGSGNVLIATSTDDVSNKLQVNGNAKITGNLAVTGKINIPQSAGTDNGDIWLQ